MQRFGLCFLLNVEFGGGILLVSIGLLTALDLYYKESAGSSIQRIPWDPRWELGWNQKR